MLSIATTMVSTRSKLVEAEQKAGQLFQAIEDRGLVQPGKTETQVNQEVFDLAMEMFGIQKYWHKRIVRSGPNTLFPYDENPPDLVVQKNDILFFDFGPIFEEWEADFGRTYVIGEDPDKHKLKSDIEEAWYSARDWYNKQNSLTGAELFAHAEGLAKDYGWEFGGEIAGHLIGHFPHERLEKGNYGLYVHPGNHNDMFLPDKEGKPRNWILEIHFVDRAKKIGGFFEQLLT
ncbi:MAG TPA: M24 family metallopeptidase [Flavitalea sp.]|nr:M24 family metallopeptidase [Flavitalea sp.]